MEIIHDSTNVHNFQLISRGKNCSNLSCFRISDLLIFMLVLIGNKVKCYPNQTEYHFTNEIHVFTQLFIFYFNWKMKAPHMLLKAFAFWEFHCSYDWSYTRINVSISNPNLRIFRYHTRSHFWESLPFFRRITSGIA